MKRNRPTVTRFLLAMLFAVSVSMPAMPGEASGAAPAAGATLRFSFGTASSPVDPGWARVTAETRYAGGQGYGWLASPSLSAREQDTGSAARRAFVAGTAPATFRVSLPASGAFYEVWLLAANNEADIAPITVTVGNQRDNPTLVLKRPSPADGLTGGGRPISAGQAAGSTSQPGTSVTVHRQDIWAAGAYLDFTFSAARSWQINALMVRQQAGPSLKPPSVPSSVADTGDLLFDFGTPASPVEPGWTQATSTTLYSESQGYGWVNPAGLSATDQGTHDNLDRDFVAGTSPAVWRVNVPVQNAPYEIWLLVDNTGSDVPTMTVSIQNGWDNPVYMVQDPWMLADGTYYGNLAAKAGIPTTFYRFAIWAMSPNPFIDIQLSAAAGAWQINALALRQQAGADPALSQYSYEVAISNAQTAPATTSLPVFTVPDHFWYNSQKFGNAQQDWAYVTDWINSYTTPDMTPDAKFHAVMVAMHSLTGLAGLNHPVDVLANGGGYCTGLANLETMAAWVVGLPARNIAIDADSGLQMPLYLPSDPYHSPEGGAHEVSEVYLDGQWHMIENNGDEYPAFDDFLAGAAEWGTIAQYQIYAARTTIYHGYDGTNYWTSVYSPSTASIIYPGEPDHQYRLSTHDPRQPGLLRLGASVTFDGPPVEIQPGITALQKTFWLSTISPDVQRVVTRIPFTQDYAGVPTVSDWYLSVNGHKHLLGTANTDWGASTGDELQLEIPMNELVAGWNTLVLGADTPNSAEGLWVNTSTDVTNLTTTIISGTQSLPSLDAAWFMDLEYGRTVDPGPPDPVQLMQAGWALQAANLAWTAPGDNWNTGEALTYEVRYAGSPILTSNWLSATVAADGAYTVMAGSVLDVSITGLAPSSTYYVAAKSFDKAGNVSPLSDNLIVKTGPFIIYWPVMLSGYISQR